MTEQPVTAPRARAGWRTWWPSVVLAVVLGVAAGAGVFALLRG